METHEHPVLVTDNPKEHRFEAQIGPYLAVAEYRRSGDIITFTHTEVPQPLEGHGIAGQLARTALEQARTEGLSVVPLCPYFASYIRRHPEYADLVAPAYRRSHGE
jgi:predicted GNAT family acetyltransferase